jgi:hypothetical protein
VDLGAKTSPMFISDEAVVEVVVLVRPDGHVAWRGVGGQMCAGGTEQDLAAEELGGSRADGGRFRGGGSGGFGVDEATSMMAGLMRRLLCLQP